MVDPQVYVEVVKKCLQECRDQAKAYKFPELANSIDHSIEKCTSMLAKGPEEYARKKKDKEITDSELFELIKKPSFINELEELDVSKIKNHNLRDKISSLLAKRPLPTPSKKETEWETDLQATLKAKLIKTD